MAVPATMPRNTPGQADTGLLMLPPAPEGALSVVDGFHQCRDYSGKARALIREGEARGGGAGGAVSDAFRRLFDLLLLQLRDPVAQIGHLGVQFRQLVFHRLAG